MTPGGAGQEVAGIVAAAAALDWASPQSAAAWADARLGELAARPGLIAALVREFLRSPEGGESYPHMDKIVLWSGAGGALRLRLHLFAPGYADRPHNHRWSFASRVLAGSYLHTLYGSQDDVLAQVRQDREPTPRCLGRQPAGTSYFLHHDAVHSLRVDEPAVSLVLRGPSVKEEYFTVLPADGVTSVTGRLEWSRGAARETPAQARAKQMTAAGLTRVASVLRDVLETGPLFPPLAAAPGRRPRAAHPETS